MTELTIGSLVKNPEPSQIKSVGPKQDGTFDDLMQEAVGKISQVQNDAESAVKKLASGGDPAEAIIAMEKADMNFQLMIEVRNKLISAYQQVMNMQV